MSKIHFKYLESDLAHDLRRKLGKSAAPQVFGSVEPSKQRFDAAHADYNISRAQKALLQE